jgi:hypothetical protein
MPPPKHLPFHSIYRENYEVVEERQRKVSLYPHTEQLPLLLRALNLEFFSKLPDRIARVDHRGDGFHKIVLYHATMMFCQCLNRTRADRLRLFNLPNPDLVTKVSIVQQITEERPRGPVHRFRFYTGPDFFPEIRLSGRRLVFADHVLQRFSMRVPNYVGEDLANFLETFYGHAVISLPCGPGRAFIVPYRNSILAFPYREETPGEYFIATCLTLNEINRLPPELPPCVHNFHYAETYTSPKLRHWITIQRFIETYERWTKKQAMEPLTDGKKRFKWDHKLGLVMRDVCANDGHGRDSRLLFLDQIPGPHVTMLKPGQKEVLVDEFDCCVKCGGTFDWPAAFARRDAILNGLPAAAEAA